MKLFLSQLSRRCFALTAVLVSFAAASTAQASPLFDELFAKGNLTALSQNKAVQAGLRGPKNQPTLLLVIKTSSNTNTTGKDQSIALRAKKGKKRSNNCFLARIPSSHFKGKLAYWNGAEVASCIKSENGNRVRWMGLQARKDKNVRLGTY